MTLRFKDNY